jgi:hypothetical protein
MNGDTAHLFTGKQLGFLGWMLEVAPGWSRAGVLWYGWSIGVVTWQASYLLNKEFPRLGVAMEPLPVDLQCAYVDLGLHATLHLRLLSIRPYLSLPVGLTSVIVDAGDGDIQADNALYLGAAGGLEARLNISRAFGLTAGYRLTWPAYSSIHLTANDVSLAGQVRRPVEELYAGVTLTSGE